MSLKVYVSGPMTGLPDNNYPEFFDVQSKLEAHRFTVLNPARVDAMFPRTKDEPSRDWLWYMRKCIVMLTEADGVATLRGWQNSRGATAEVQLAQAMGLPVMPWQSWALKAAEADAPPAKIRRPQATPVTHMQGKGDRPYCGTKGKPKKPMTDEWSKVDCHRCNLKKSGRNT